VASRIPQTTVRLGRSAVALIDHDGVYLMAPVAVLEQDHPQRRFVCMLALVGREMQLPPNAEPYDDERAAFYARAALIADDAFLSLDDGRPDAALAEHFNVPLEQVEAKRYDLAFLRSRPRDAPR
jgi:hypothetical protein